MTDWRIIAGLLAVFWVCLLIIIANLIPPRKKPWERHK